MAEWRSLVRELGRLATSLYRLYLVGGATAVIEGWHESTIDIDLRLEPDADGLLRAFAEVKERIGVNIELASPPDFIPDLPGWRERSPFVLQHESVSVHHYDLYSRVVRGDRTPALPLSSDRPARIQGPRRARGCELNGFPESR